mgnify:FL=1
MPYAQVDSIAKMIPNELNITIDKALQMNHELRELYQGNEEVAHLIDMSRRLEGLPRHTSMHAAGVVIGSRPLVEFVPLSRGSDGTIVTQFTMTTLEELGLLKMDFLGLRTLTVIQNATKLAERYSNKKIDLLHIDYNDPKVLGMIGASKTVGVFQLESAGMKNFMKELKPQSLEDIIAGISLYRPGPMDFIRSTSKEKQPGIRYVRYTALKTDSGADVRLYRLPGTGYADRTGTGGLFAWTGRSGAPCDVEEKGIRHGKRAPEFRLWKRGRGRAGLYQKRH